MSVQKHGNRTRSLRFLSFTPPHCLHTTTMATHTQPRAAHNHSQEITHQHRTTSTTITTTSSAHCTPLSLLSLVFFSLLFSHLFSIIGGLIDKSKAYEARHHAAETWMSGSVRGRTIRSGRFRGWCPDGPSLRQDSLAWRRMLLGERSTYPAKPLFLLVFSGISWFFGVHPNSCNMGHADHP